MLRHCSCSATLVAERDSSRCANQLAFFVFIKKSSACHPTAFGRLPSGLQVFSLCPVLLVAMSIVLISPHPGCLRNPEEIESNDWLSSVTSFCRGCALSCATSFFSLAKCQPPFSLSLSLSLWPTGQAGGSLHCRQRALQLEKRIGVASNSGTINAEKAL